MARKQKQTTMQLAVVKLIEGEQKGTGSATPEQIMAVAVEFELEVWAVEGVYLDECDKMADERP
jgi:hypothetical protein